MYQRICLLMAVLFFSLTTGAIAKMPPADRVVIVLTSHATLGDKSGDPTGYYLSEAAHAYYIFKEAGLGVDFASPKGGSAPVTGLDVKDPLNTKFLNDAEAQAAVAGTLKLSELDPKDYKAIYYAGGHGVMWDFAQTPAIGALGRAIYENGGIVSAVCHGPAALVNLKLSNGKYLVDGKRIATFTNKEEAAIKLTKVVPFALETALVDRGAKVIKADLFQPKTVVDGRLVTGQNPASAKGVARAVVDLIIQHR